MHYNPAIFVKTHSKARFSTLWGYYALVAVTSIFGSTAVVSASFLNLGGADDYAVVAIGGDVNLSSDFQLYQSATVIDGNVAEGPYNKLGHGIDATVNGRWDYDLTDSDPSASGYTGHVSGGFHQLDLSGVVADGRAATNTASAFAPTQVFSSLQNGQTIIGTSGLNVIKITGDSTIKTTLTLQGTPTSSFIFQFTSPTKAGKSVLTLSGMTMNLVGGIQPDNIYWVFKGKGGDITINAMAQNQTVYGNFLAPDRNLTADHANVVGRLIAGGSGSSLNIHSASHITKPPPASH